MSERDAPVDGRGSCFFVRGTSHARSIHYLCWLACLTSVKYGAKTHPTAMRGPSKQFRKDRLDNFTSTSNIDLATKLL
eukprot:scaffold21551_cov44-Prasinocladus_malaysianus.AAC.3